MSIEIRARKPAPHQDEVLTPEALEFLAELHKLAVGRRQELLHLRRETRTDIANGRDPRFRTTTGHIRDDDSWRCAPVAPGLADRRVELTGPTDPKMTIRAMNSGANVWLADHEDALTPSWPNVIGGQHNLIEALRGTLEYITAKGTHYKIEGTHTPTVALRPRGWHLVEKQLVVDRVPMAGGLVDFGLYFFHNAQWLIDHGSGPYFYLPKLENHLEARLWNDLFVKAQDLLGIPQGTVRATVLIETITAAFEMEEIIYELRDHMAGLNAGKWDYFFSIIKNFRKRGPRFILPDRDQVTENAPFMKTFTEQLLRAAHRRGIHAIGGMAAHFPNEENPEATEQVMAEVREDKRQQAEAGFDGSWVAHTGLVDICREEFDKVLGDKPNQIDKLRDDVKPVDHELINLNIPGTSITDEGVRTNVEVGIRYIESWLRGNGAAAINNFIEDASTAEISRSQIWQWTYHEVDTAEGHKVTHDRVMRIIDEEFDKIERFDGDKFDEARELFEEVALEDDYPTFLTIPGYTRYLSVVHRPQADEAVAADE